MSLADRCLSSFDPKARTRGNSYFQQDRVEFLGSAGLNVGCSVQGDTGDYAVSIDLQEMAVGTISAACDCPRFSRGYLCKHIWASLREIDVTVDLPGDEKLLVKRDPNVSFDLESDDDAPPVTPRGAKTSTDKPSRKSDRKSSNAWKSQFAAVKHFLNDGKRLRRSPVANIAADSRQICYVIHREDHYDVENLVLRTYERQKKQDGTWSVPQKKSISSYDVDHLGESEDAEILRTLRPATVPGHYSRYGSAYHSDGFALPKGPVKLLLPRIAATGRLFWANTADQFVREYETLKWDSRSWRLRLKVQLTEDLREIEVQPEIYAKDEIRPFAQITASYSEGVVVFQNSLSELVDKQDVRWIDLLVQRPFVPVPASEVAELFELLTTLPGVPELVLDERLEITHAQGQPTGKLVVRAPDENEGGAGQKLFIDPFFKYDDQEIASDDPRREVWLEHDGILLQRNWVTEADLLEELRQYQFEKSQDHFSDGVQLSVGVAQFVELASSLVESGWEVIAHGRPLRQLGSIEIQIESDQDWFDLRADADYGGVSASLPSLLAAMKQKSPFIVLDDGSHGILPEEWLQKYAKLAEVAEQGEDSLRFTRSQALLLDAMLAEQDVKVDLDFGKLCKKLKDFDGIAPGKEPRGFHGELRDYQRDGVGWFSFLRDFGFGGCLADDMGLGKTVQVLAMLQSRKTRRLKKGEQRLPSIVVVPKSLVFNWIDEASRFAPKLRTINYTGGDRWEALAQLEQGDLLVTTYGTLRRDIETLREIEFDYVILDEAQAVKNAKSLAAKAVRLLNSNHRLAMTGTPVENHIGELWSLFDFLNPGMLGTGEAFKRVARAANLRANDASESRNDILAWLSNAIRPFILRRTKEQVLTELPEKIEQTLVCEMTSKQNKKYNELRDYYRVHLSKTVEDKGIKRSKIHVLEALLRLRQAACDPRLLDEEAAAGAKIELLVEQLEKLIADGHKALVFSQFTSLLALVRAEFDERSWNYEYLDGKTRKRADKVERFQTDEDCSVFLISLKAGGSGLNLTAADYVFILDPWWNPAVEAQAVDRAHRIGQTKSVMAYRILCRDTVEDKIIKLQQSKRDLADAIITADKSLISELSMDDLQMLLE